MNYKEKGDCFYGAVSKGKNGRKVTRVTTATLKRPFPNRILGRKCDRRVGLIEGSVELGKGYLFQIMESFDRHVIVRPVEGPFWIATSSGYSGWSLEGKLFKRQYYTDIIAHCLFVAKSQQSAGGTSGIVFLSSLNMVTENELTLASLHRFATEYALKKASARDYARRQIEKIATGEILWRNQSIKLSTEQIADLLRILD